MAAVQAIIAARAATAALSSEQTDRNQREFEERFEESERLQAEVSFKWNAGRPKPSDYSPGSLKARYVAMSNQLHIKVTSTEKFELFFQACIGVMCVLMGLETYDSMEANPTLELLMLILICFFAMEVFLKLFAEGTKPWRYFCGPDGRWNTLDLLIVILSIPMLPVGESGRVLRMIRLLRLVKIISKMDSFRVFVCGIEEATGDIINISSLIGLVLYMYSVAGMVLLGENDPWNFGSLHRSFITLFAMATMDGWAGILYKNAYGCAAYYEGEGMAEEMAEDIQMKCAGNVTAPITTAIFCLSFVTITGLVMLSMFIGVISIAMSETIVKVRKEKKHEMQRKVMKRKAEKILEAKREAASPETQGQNTKTSMQDVDEYNQQQKLIGQTKMLFMGDSTKPVYMEQTTAFGQQLQKLAKVCKKLVESDKFVFFVFALIIAGGLLVAMKMYFREQLTGITDVVGQLMTIVFTIEMILKILSEGGTPLHYIYKDCEFQNWNILDAFVVICNYTSIKTDLLMVLRMVLVLKLMKMHPYLRVSVQSFLASIGATGVIGCLMGIVFFFFAIVGVVLFKKNDPAHFQNLHIAMLTLFRVATLDDWVDVMNTNLYGCEIFTDEAIPAKFRECDVEASKHAASIGIVAVIYFLIFIIVGTFVMLNLFIGVIMIEMEATMSQLESERDVDMRAKALGKKHQYGRKELTDLREMFDMMDADSSGDVNLEELQLTVDMAELDITKEDIEAMLDEIDEDGTGEIDFAEFVQFAVKVRERLNEEVAAAKLAADGSPDSVAVVPKPVNRWSKAVKTATKDLKKQAEEKSQKNLLIEKEKQRVAKEAFDNEVAKTVRLAAFIRRKGLAAEFAAEEGVELQGATDGGAAGGGGGVGATAAGTAAGTVQGMQVVPTLSPPAPPAIDSKPVPANDFMTQQLFEGANPLPNRSPGLDIPVTLRPEPLEVAAATSAEDDLLDPSAHLKRILI